MVKKILLPIYFLISFFPNLASQNIVIHDFVDNLVSNDTVLIEGNTNDNLVEMGLKITNNGQAAINVKVKKEEISIVEGTENYFCWKECYTPDVFVSPDFLTIEAGVTNDRSFKGDYKPNQKNGESKIRYTFFNVDDEKDTVTVVVVYNVLTTTAINHPFENNKNFGSLAYPVPAKEFVAIKYNLDNVNGVKLEIFNLQAQKIEEKAIVRTKGEFTLLSDHYQPGIYLYQFTQNGKKIDSGKIIFQ